MKVKGSPSRCKAAASPSVLGHFLIFHDTVEVTMYGIFFTNIISPSRTYRNCCGIITFYLNMVSKRIANRFWISFGGF